LGIVAKWLHVALPEKVKPKALIDALLEERPKAVLRELTVPSDSYAVGKKIVQIGFPANTTIPYIKRNSAYLVPGGSTRIEAGDTLVVLCDTEDGPTKVCNALRIPVTEHID
jgi:cell volume regulation protein A